MLRDEIVILNILTIILSGLALVIAGVAMLLFREQIMPYFKYLLPIPPISVGVYVFVFNLFKDGGGKEGAAWHLVLLEVVKASLVASFSFFIIAFFMALVIKVLMRLR